MNDIYADIKRCEPESMGYMISDGWRKDPKRLAFTTARYKFVAKMLEGKRNVLEVGAGDGWVSRIVAQHVGDLYLTDIDGAPGIDRHDFLKGPRGFTFDAAYLLDVLEHIPEADEDTFLNNVKLSVNGPVIVGMPSLESQVYASELSRLGHVNCKSKENLRNTMLKHWNHVFMFGMNDETLHTGISASYWLALGV